MTGERDREKPLRILFVLADLFFSEPLGAMGLAAICGKEGHAVRFMGLKKHGLRKTLEGFSPHLVAYSAMTPEIGLFQEADARVRQWAAQTNPVTRIMGGPHPTYFPEILEEMDLDAVCVGEGDLAMAEVARRVQVNKNLDRITNVIARGRSLDTMDRRLVQDLDALPYPDRDAFFSAAPLFRQIGLRSVLRSRGCPFHCTYCHNHAFNRMFSGCGPVVRKRSPESLIREIVHLKEDYQPVRMIRFADDTFALRIDDELIRLLGLYKKEVGLPFYCLMRSNAMDEDMARLLAAHGCVSVGMSIESGSEDLRNRVLKRNLTDKQVKASFEACNKYGIKTYANSILALPGADITDDLESFAFAKKLKASVPTFSIFAPYPRTELSDFALEKGYLKDPYDSNDYMEKSLLNSFTQKEKDTQVNIVYLGTLFGSLPDAFLPLFHRLIHCRPNALFRFAGSAHMVWKMGKDIFPNVIPKKPVEFLRLFAESVKSLNP